MIEIIEGSLESLEKSQTGLFIRLGPVSRDEPAQESKPREQRAIATKLGGRLDAINDRIIKLRDDAEGVVNRLEI